MVGESNQNVFLIQIEASSLAEFEISEFEISRVDCMKSHSPLAQGYQVGGSLHKDNVISDDVNINNVMFWRKMYLSKS